MKSVIRILIFSAVFTVVNFNGYAQNTNPIQSDFYSIFKNESFNSKNTEHTSLKVSAGSNSCASATLLLIDGGVDCGNTNGADTEVGENVCNPGTSGTAQTVWYRFNTDTLTTLNLAFFRNNFTNCDPVLTIYGPFSSGAGCLPSASDEVLCYQQGLFNDPGYHERLQSLSPNSDYLISVQGRRCGGPRDRNLDYCISLASSKPNTNLERSSSVDACGVTYDGTNVGYGASTLPDSINNPDVDGDGIPEVAYYINNDAWFNFCADVSSTWELVFSVSNCQFSYSSDLAPFAGLQLTIFKGDTSNLDSIQSAPNPTLSGTTWTSSAFSLAAGECAYFMIDGFAGDQCDFTYQINNLSGGCSILPLSFLNFRTESHDNGVLLNWKVMQLINEVSGFTVQKSKNLKEFYTIGELSASADKTSYEFLDMDGLNSSTAYYRIKYANEEGVNYSEIIKHSVESEEVRITKTGKRSVYVENLFSSEEIYLFDLMGKQYAANVQSYGTSFQLDLNRLERGVYIIRAGSKSKKFVLD